MNPVALQESQVIPSSDAVVLVETVRKSALLVRLLYLNSLGPCGLAQRQSSQLCHKSRDNGEASQSLPWLLTVSLSLSLAGLIDMCCRIMIIMLLGCIFDEFGFLGSFLNTLWAVDRGNWIKSLYLLSFASLSESAS